MSVKLAVIQASSSSPNDCVAVTSLTANCHLLFACRFFCCCCLKKPTSPYERDDSKNRIILIIFSTIVQAIIYHHNYLTRICMKEREWRSHIAAAAVDIKHVFKIVKNNTPKWFSGEKKEEKYAYEKIYYISTCHNCKRKEKCFFIKQVKPLIASKHDKFKFKLL